MDRPTDTPDRQDTQWRTRALCAEIPEPDLFFPDRSEPADEALAVCDYCPVILACRAYALRHGIREGVWGGLTEQDRDQLRSAYGNPRGQLPPSRWIGLSRRPRGA
jgi:WhiB family redox-sensing transcriptional regulator